VSSVFLSKSEKTLYAQIPTKMTKSEDISRFWKSAFLPKIMEGNRRYSIHTTRIKGRTTRTTTVLAPLRPKAYEPKGSTLIYAWKNLGKMRENGQKLLQ
jgi:hypothetical protein